MPRQSEKIVWCGLAVVLALVQACSKQAPPKPFIARVDESVLTDEDLVAMHDSLGNSPSYRREHINGWVNNELLYQEARKRGIPDDPSLRRQIDAAARTLVVSALLEEELYGDENVSEDEIVALYNGGGEAFRLREDVINGSYVLFGDRDAANTFRDRLIRGMAWGDAVADAHRDSSMRPHLLQIATRRYFTQTNLYPPELWKIARSLAKDEVSFAVKTGAGYYILVAAGAKRQGELPDLDYIRNDIRGRILIEKRRVLYEKFLAELRTTHSVEVRLADIDSATHANE